MTSWHSLNMAAARFIAHKVFNAFAFCVLICVMSRAQTIILMQFCLYSIVSINNLGQLLDWI